MATVRAYIRVSTESQARTGLGMDAQRKQLTEACEARKLPAPVFYVDEAKSGGKPMSKRPSGRRLIAELQPGDIVMVAKFDRVFRNVEDALRVHKIIKNLSCRLIVLNFMGMDADSTTPQGEFMFLLMAGFAQMERRMAAQRVREAAAVRRSRGEYMGASYPPLGKRWTISGDNRPTLADDERLRKQMEVIDLLRKTGLSSQSVACRLVKEGVYREVTRLRRVYRDGTNTLLRYKVDKDRIPWSVDAVDKAVAIVNGKPVAYERRRLGLVKRREKRDAMVQEFLEASDE